MDGRWDGKTVVVTGASAGVGRAVALAFAREGARVALIARSPDGLESARQEVDDAGGQAMAIPADVADAQQLENAAARVEETWGPIDVWVNNAMVSVFSPFKEMTADEFRRVTEVTYLGFVHGTQSALRRMLPRDRGVVVQVGSALAYRGIPLQSAYCGAKHAIQGFTESVRCELLHDQSNVKITMVQMPALNTPQFEWVRTRLPNHPQPVPPIFQPAVAAEGILWAAEHAPRELKVGAPTAVAILLNKIVPGLLEQHLANSGYESQQMSGEPVDPNRPDNLWQPVPGLHRTHGRFDARSRERSPQLWAATHQSWLLGGMAALAAVATFAGRVIARTQERRRPGWQRALRRVAVPGVGRLSQP